MEHPSDPHCKRLGGSRHRKRSSGPTEALTFSLGDSPTFNKAALSMRLLLFFIRTDIKNYNCLQGKDTALGIIKGFGRFLAFLFMTKTLAHFISVHAS